MMPGSAAGSSTLIIVSPRVAPMASEPSRRLRGTAFSASSESEETKGMIITPITRPAASAEFGEVARPIRLPAWRIAGATVSTAKKP